MTKLRTKFHTLTCNDLLLLSSYMKDRNNFLLAAILYITFCNSSHFHYEYSIKVYQITQF
jgi:hypothetical protein